jgi:hypothetical protein
VSSHTFDEQLDFSMRGGDGDALSLPSANPDTAENSQRSDKQSERSKYSASPIIEIGKPPKRESQRPREHNHCSSPDKCDLQCAFPFGTKGSFTNPSARHGVFYTMLRCVSVLPMVFEDFALSHGKWGFETNT